MCVVLVNSDAKKDQQHTVVEAEQLKQVASIWTIGVRGSKPNLTMYIIFLIISFILSLVVFMPIALL